MCLALVCAAPCGCSFSTNKNLAYVGKPEPEELVSSKFSIGDVPELETCDRSSPFVTRPRTIADRTRDEVWELSLAEAIHLALINNKIARTRNDFLSPGNQLLLSPDAATSVYDAAIRDTGYLFGSRGVESALSAFDPILQTNLTFGHQANTQNNPVLSGGIPPGGILFQDSAQAVASLTKQMTYGAQFGLSQTWNYNNSNQPFQLFPSVFTGNIQFSYTQQLLAGAGTDFGRISGPLTSNIQGVSGLNQGVIIARINTDMTLIDFETQVRNMVHDVEALYWELYLSYQNYHSLIEARNASLKLWQAVNAKAATGLPGGGGAEEAQARESYFEARARSEAALGGPAGRGGEQGIYGIELQLRRLCGLPANDGRIIRPSDEPTLSHAVPDWDICLATACTRREELRKQKWNIKSLELQLRAAKNLARPQLNFVSSYQLNGFGRLLFGDNLPGTAPGDDLQNYTRNLLQGNTTGWNVGFQFSMPLGLRNALAQVRNSELRLLKAQTELEAQEMEVGHELASTFQALDFYYQNMQTNFNRREAASANLEAIRNEYKLQRKGLDLVLQAQTRLTIADVAFYRSVIEYNKSLAELQLRQGTLLEYNHIHLAERDWGPDAKMGASRLARARSYAFDAFPLDPVHHEPEAFVPRHFAPSDAAGAYPSPEVPVEFSPAADGWGLAPGGTPSAEISMPKAERTHPNIDD
ncbi:MAG: TolC family protein [Planctomycetia bacterium]|nr:TolC family protein [Planctomycetia bacterium]